MVGGISGGVPPSPATGYRQNAMLTDTAIRNAKPKAAPYKLADERALYLLVTPAGGKLWRLNYRHGGKRKTLALGAYPDVSLVRAREKRDEARRLLADGIDPGAQRKASKAAAAVTFQGVAEEFVAQRRGILAPTTLRKLEDRLKWLYRYIGDKPVTAVTAADILEPLRAIEAAGNGETARRTRVAAGQVFRFAIATARAENDPTAALRGALAPVIGRHHAAVTEPRAFGGLLRAIEGYEGEPVTRAALRLLPLVFVRPGELRMARWAEIDVDAGTWLIPAGRMKMKADHIVPLSRQAVAILRELHPLTGRAEFVFPSFRRRDRSISDNTLNASLRRLGFSKETATAHGFRASARTLLDEALGFRVDLIEHQLAHAVRDPNGRAYNRTAFLPERAAMLQAWADYCDKLRTGADVIPFPALRASSGSGTNA